MYLIGLTGNIATGKTIVLNRLAARGAETVDADRVAHEVMRRGQPAWAQVKARFGDRILRPDGEIDRQALGGIVFADPDALRELDSLVHPWVRARIEEMVAEENAPAMVVEAIKLIESGLAASCQAIWVTTSSSSHQLERLVRHRGLTEEAALLRIAAQPDPGAKVSQADVLLENEGSREELEALVDSEWQAIELGAAPGMGPQPEVRQLDNDTWQAHEGEHRACARRRAGGEWRLRSASATRLPRLFRPLLSAIASQETGEADEAIRFVVPARTSYCQFMRGMGYREVHQDGIEPGNAVYRA